MVIIIARLRRRRAVLRRQKSFKCVLNPLNGLTDGYIFCRYRFRRETTIFLVTLLSPAIQYHTSRSMAVPPLIQILATLRFLATGSFYRLVGDSLGLSIASVARSVDRVTSAVCRLSRTYIKFPTGQYLSDTKKKFFELAVNFNVYVIFTSFCCVMMSKKLSPSTFMYKQLVYSRTMEKEHI
ncbi:hypothetical protein KUTeg_011785 [Tegillarca granosa]|uniref:Nuclease HARBI1 n=1 Tax=Tegillarca granosa TaxID=220873 RepID=A0ABQ9EXN3_TEGGR|nr:hypothetical protein KUTeg_011785 [Tegillarca granosa]